MTSEIINVQEYTNRKFLIIKCVLKVIFFLYAIDNPISSLVKLFINIVLLKRIENKYYTIL